jgi:hypothetical protein
MPYQLAPFGDVADAKVGGQIDHAHSRVEQRRCLLHRHAVRGGEEDDVAALQVGRGRILETSPIVRAGWETSRDVGAGVSPRSDAATI